MTPTQVADEGGAVGPRTIAEAKCGGIAAIDKHNALQTVGGGGQFRLDLGLTPKQFLAAGHFHCSTGHGTGQPPARQFTDGGGFRKRNRFLVSGLQNSACQWMLGVTLQA